MKESIYRESGMETESAYHGHSDSGSETDEMELDGSEAAPLPLELPEPPVEPTTDGKDETSEQTPKNVAVNYDATDDDDDGRTCSICFDVWNNSGEHRPASLKCGHIFGMSCIKKWLKGQGGKCPQCNAAAQKKDVRVLYAKSLLVQDTADKDRLIAELEKEREEKRRLELQFAQTKLKYELKSQLVEKLQAELKSLQEASCFRSSSDFVGSQSRKWKLILHSTIDITKDGGCRVMCYSEWLNMLVISVPSQVAVFPGFGVKKVNLLDIRCKSFISLHTKQIRDMAFSPAKHDLLLSVSMDKIVKITNVCSNTVIQAYHTDSPLWSCCWNTCNCNEFFVGTAFGTVLIFDAISTDSFTHIINTHGSGPVVSLTYVPESQSSSFPYAGLLVLRLQSCSFVTLKSGFKEHSFTVEGPFTNISFEADARSFLVSCRPSHKFPHARHAVCELSTVKAGEDTVIVANVLHSFQGGTTQKVLSRSCLFKNPFDKSVMIIANDESTQSTCIWDLNTFNCVQQIKNSDNVIDILPFKNSDREYVALLTERFVKLYKWVDV